MGSFGVSIEKLPKMLGNPIEAFDFDKREVLFCLSWVQMYVWPLLQFFICVLVLYFFGGPGFSSLALYGIRCVVFMKFNLLSACPLGTLHCHNFLRLWPCLFWVVQILKIIFLELTSVCSRFSLEGV
jgi:hypothetical protein